MTADVQFQRIVALVAELTRAERQGDDTITLRQLAERHDVTDRTIADDIRTLTILGDRAQEADWLLSIRIWQQEDRVSITSAGPFRRPVRLSPEEQLAVQLALAIDPDGANLATRLSALWNGTTHVNPAKAQVREEAMIDVVRRAVHDHAVLQIEYAGEVQREVRTRTILPHQVAESGVRTYVVAWDEEVGAWRHFRLDRILSASMTDRRFEPRADFEPMERPRDAFRPHGTTERVTVRFSADAAPWVTEFYAGSEQQPDGSVLVHFDVSSPEWLVRRVLEFGADAEVIAPAEYRAAMAKAVA
jgi:proteasome accessory factor C